MIGSDVVALFPSTEVKGFLSTPKLMKSLRKGKTTMSSASVTGPRTNSERDEDEKQEKLQDLGMIPTSQEMISTIIARVLQVNLIHIFENFFYKFRGKSYYQREGGPIGTPATGSATAGLIEETLKEVKEDVKRSKGRMKIIEDGFYVQDQLLVAYLLLLLILYRNQTFLEESFCSIDLQLESN